MPDCHLQREIDVKISGNKKIRCETDSQTQRHLRKVSLLTTGNQILRKKCLSRRNAFQPCQLDILHSNYCMLLKSFVDSEKLPCFCEIQKVTKWIQIEMPWCFKWRQVVLELWQHNFGLLGILACGCTSKHLSHCNTSSSNDQEWRFLWIPAMGPGKCLKLISERSSSTCSHPSDSVLVVGFKNKNFWWDGARKGSKCHTAKSIVGTMGLCEAAPPAYTIAWTGDERVKEKTSMFDSIVSILPSL